MPRPIKFSEKGAPLDCADHDNNIDALLDRANHTGKQPASTISDLELFITNSAPVKDLDERLDAVEEKILTLQDDVFNPGGYIDTLFKTLQNEYREGDKALDVKIQDLKRKINELEQADNNLQGLIDGLTNRVQTNENDIDDLEENLDDLTDRVEVLENEMDVAETEIERIKALLGNNNVNQIVQDLTDIRKVTDPVNAKEKFLVEPPPNQSDGLRLAWDFDNNIPEWRLPGLIDGGPLIYPEGEKIGLIVAEP